MYFIFVMNVWVFVLFIKYLFKFNLKKFIAQYFYQLY